MSDREMFRMAKSDLKIIGLILAGNNIEDSMINQAASHIGMAVEKLCKYAISIDESDWYPDTKDINVLLERLDEDDIYYPKEFNGIGSALNTWRSAGPFSEVGMTSKSELNEFIDIIESWIIELDAYYATMY